jgi:hypothetical protein
MYHRKNNQAAEYTSVPAGQGVGGTANYPAGQGGAGYGYQAGQRDAAAGRGLWRPRVRAADAGELWPRRAARGRGRPEEEEPPGELVRRGVRGLLGLHMAVPWTLLLRPLSHPILCCFCCARMVVAQFWNWGSLGL